MFQKLSAQSALKAATVAVAVVMLTAGASLAQDRQPERNTKTARVVVVNK